MSKIKIEDLFTNHIQPLLEGEGFNLIKKRLSGEHYLIFEKSDFNAKYTWSLSFLKYGKVAVVFKIFFNETTSLYKQCGAEGIIPFDIFSLE